MYIPSRIFFGYIPDPSLEQLTYTNPLAVENEINYDEETCGFDECSETDESSEETSESTDYEGKTDTQQNNDEDILKQMNQIKDDDIDQEVDETGMLLQAGVKRQKAILDYLARH